MTEMEWSMKERVKIKLVLFVLIMALSLSTPASAPAAGEPHPAGSLNNPDSNPDVRRPAKSGTEIVWDTWGVPHIFAQSEVSAFRAFGWAQMHNHEGVLLRLIAQGRGRGAEFYGEHYFNGDRVVHTLGLYATARAWYVQQTPRFRRDLDAFAAGINEYAREHPEKVEAVGRSILPVDGTDVLAHTIRVLEMFINEASIHSGGGCSVVEQGDRAAKGSNGWAIGPSHSTDGHAMLLANPHLPWSSGEYTFFEAQISAPGYKAYGAALLGFPVLQIAFNDTHGWTHTINPVRGCDTYALVSEKDSYQLDGQMRAFDSKEELIKVKQNDGNLKDEYIKIRRSLLGPVVENDGKLFAVRIAGLQAGSFARALQEWWEMGRARTFAQFQSALNQMQLPMFNVIYADREGNIELVYDGLVPRRNGGASSDQTGVLSGASSTAVWNKFYGFKDLPKAINPASGWVQNSNSVPWYMTEPFLSTAQYPPDIAPRGEPSTREQRGMKMLLQESKISYDKLLADQYSTRCELADRVLNDLIAAARQSDNHLALEAAAILDKWDRETNADSKGAVLFYTWLQKMGDNFFAESFDVGHPLDTPRELKDPNAAVAALIASAGELRRRNLPLDVPWGNVFRLHRGTFDFSGSGGAGRLGIFDGVSYTHAEGGRFESNFGDSFMAEVEFSVPLKARVLLTYGNSSDPNSPHYGDQLALLAKKDWREVWRARSELAQHVEERTVLNTDERK